MQRYENQASRSDTGNTYRWVILLVIGLATFFTFFHRMSASVIQADLSETFSISATSFGTFSALCFYPYVLMQIPVGLLADTIGVRKTVSIGCLITAAGTIVFASAGSFAMACVGRFLVGFGIASPVVCTQKITAVWFPARRVATASAFAGTLGNLGGLFAQTPLALLIGYLGWRFVFSAAAAATLLLAGICFAFLRDSPAEKLRSSPPPTSRAAGNHAGFSAPVKKTFRDRRILCLLPIMLIQMGIYQMFSGTWGISYLRDVYGYTNVEASSYTSLMMIGMMAFYLLTPVISDNLKLRKLPLIVISGLTFIVWLIIAYGSNLLFSGPLMTVVMILMGATSGSFPLFFSMIREYSDPRYVGTAVGACNMIGMAAGAFFPIICGRLIDYLVSGGIMGATLYRYAFTFAVVLAAAAFLISFFTVETHCRNISEEPDMGPLEAAG